MEVLTLPIWKTSTCLTLRPVEWRLANCVRQTYRYQILRTSDVSGPAVVTHHRHTELQADVGIM